MNSLTELNGYVNGFSLPFTDERLPDVIFDRPTPTNQTQSVDRGFTVSGSVGMDILEILNAPSSNPIYTIDVTALPGATVSYASLPPGVSLLNPSTGVYVITGFVDKAQWDLIKSPTIDFSDDFVGSFTYTSTISFFSYYTGATTYTWTTAVTVNNILFWTNATQFIYSLSAVSNITGEPNLGNLDAAYPTATWTVTITPSTIDSINTFTTTGTGGTFSVNPSTKVITISGTRAQVNNRLQGLQIDANALSIDFVLTYFASNSVNAVTDTRTQNMLSQGLAVLGAVSQPTIYYNEDTAFTITGAPQITDTIYDGTGTYSYTITPSDVAAISTATIGGSGGTASFNNSTKVISISGTRSQVNGRLNSITITPTTDYALNFNLQYFCSTPRADTANKIQVAAIGSNDTEVTNMNINRSYVSNNANTIFATNTPFISDLDVSNPTYTVIFDCANGQWTYASNLSPYVESSLANPLSITGTRSFINARFAQIKFYPTASFSSNTNFTYTQIKNGVTQVSQTVALIGSVGTYNDARTLTFLNSQIWTPTAADVRYGEIKEITLVGGGGGGAYGGGGGGQVKYSNTIIPLANQSYTITVGAGGQAVAEPTGGNPANAGGNTVAFGITASGGGGGYGAPSYGGGSSYGPDGTLYVGGTGSIINNGWNGGNPAANLKYGWNGGGGAGSGGTNVRSKISLDPYGINAPTNWDLRSFGRNGGVGVFASLGGVQLAEDATNNAAPNFGFGGGGGQLLEVTVGGGGDGGYSTYSRGGQRSFDDYDGNPNSSQQATAAQDTPRTAAVAGGGGAGGAPLATGVVPPKNGGDGIVIFRIGSK